MAWVYTFLAGWVVGLYFAWYIWPAPPLWVTKIKDTVVGWAKK